MSALTYRLKSCLIPKYFVGKGTWKNPEKLAAFARVADGPVCFAPLSNLKAPAAVPRSFMQRTVYRESGGMESLFIGKRVERVPAQNAVSWCASTE